MAISLKERLNKILLEKGLIAAEKLKDAINIQKDKGGKLSDILVNNGFIDQKDLMVVLSEELGIPPINLSRYKIDPSLIQLIPRKLAYHYKIIPISKMGNLLTVAMADPLNIFATDEIKTLTGFQIGILIATDKDIDEAIDEHYGESAHEALEEIMEGMEKVGKVEMVEDGSGKEKVDSADLVRMTQDTPVVAITNLLLSEAVKMRASDILIEPMEQTLRVRYRVDGMLKEAKNPPRSMHEAIISRLKVMSSLDIAERRLPQDGRFKIRIHGREVDFRISVLPSSEGEKIALRILDKSQATLDLDKLGFENIPLNDMKRDSKRPHGMILVCGPTGCGKTTTLYSILKYIDSPKLNIVTVEDPVEYDLYGINQVSIRPEIGLTFARSLRSILRQDPDVIMVGEIRDFETADIAIKSALTGHLVLSTLHTTTAPGAIVRLMNMGVEPFLITSSVILVAAERLARKICLNCKEEYKVDKSILEQYDVQSESGSFAPLEKTDNFNPVRKFSLSNRVNRRSSPIETDGSIKPPRQTIREQNSLTEFTFYRGKGCKACLNTGYKGRVGLMETLSLTPKIRDLISNRAQEYQIKDAARQGGMVTLRENGLKKVLAGVTTWEEVIRLTAGDQDMDTV